MADLKTTLKMAIPILYGLSILVLLHFLAFQLVLDGMMMDYIASAFPEMAESMAGLATMLPLYAAATIIFILTYLSKDIVNKW